MEQKKELTTELMQKLLGSIDLSGIEDEEEVNPKERKQYCAEIHAVYPRLEKDLKRWMYDQVVYIARDADNWEKVNFGRGTFNGLFIIWQYWKKAMEEHVANIKPEEKPDEPHSPIGEV